MPSSAVPSAYLRIIDARSPIAVDTHRQGPSRCVVCAAIPVGVADFVNEFLILVRELQIKTGRAQHCIGARFHVEIAAMRCPEVYRAGLREMVSA